jgi:hypothetical protein
MDEGRKDHLQMIQGIIDRMAFRQNVPCDERFSTDPFYGRFLRSVKILMKNCASLSKALRIA